MKVLFLDIDGPMIPHRAYFMRDHHGGFVHRFDPCAVAMVERLLVLGPCRLVISSAWQVSGRERIEKLLADNGLDPATLHDDWQTDRAERVSRLSRAREIRGWLNVHPEVTHWVALDDEPVRHMRGGGGIQMTFADGMMHRHFIRAGEILGIDKHELMTKRFGSRDQEKAA